MISHTARITANQACGITWILIIGADNALLYHALPISVADEWHKTVKPFPVTCMTYRFQILNWVFRLNTIPSYAILDKRYEDPDTLVPLRVSHLDYAVIPKPAKDHFHVPVYELLAVALSLVVIFHLYLAIFLCPHRTIPLRSPLREWLSVRAQSP